MNLQTLYEKYLRNPVIITDSRQAAPGRIFFALRGSQVDGNAFAAVALENGCACAVVDQKEYAINDKCILVDDVLQTLQALARHHRQQLSIPVIAITGTNGKTTTKELVAKVLAERYKVHATAGNFNNHIGVPLTLLSMPANTGIAVVEMGANHPGEIAFLCSIALPTHGLITNVGLAHLEGFGSFEGVLKAKTELYRHIDASNGILFVNSSQHELAKVASGLACKLLYYGEQAGDNCRGSYLESTPYLSLSLRSYEGSDESDLAVETKLVGKYNFHNVLAAACIGQYFGINNHNIARSIASYAPSNQRSQLTNTGRNILILDNYNANPSSMYASIDNFVEYKHPNKVLILGDMLELGGLAAEAHEKLLQYIGTTGIEQVYLVGPVFKKLAQGRNYLLFNNSEACAVYLKDHPVHHAAILIKGSRGIKLEKLVEYL